MRFQFGFRAVISTLCVLALGSVPARSEDTTTPATTEQGQTAVQRSLEFLQTDANKWRQERKCSTCHHGTMTVWALAEATSLGYDVSPEVLADMAKWTKDRLLARINEPRDTRPGWSMVNTPALYLAILPQAVPDQGIVSADELGQIAGHLVRHQEADGSWAWSSAPPKNRPPPYFESDEVATLLASIALRPQVPADAAVESDVRGAQEKAAAWLAMTRPTDTTQSAALRLLGMALARDPASLFEPEIERLLSRQNGDGGWGQIQDAPSDAYATGQALYVLRLAGVRNDRAEVQRGVTYLLNTQLDDGSWPMSGRAHPGAEPSNNLVPITYFGSAWAALGLMRSVPLEGLAGDANAE